MCHLLQCKLLWDPHCWLSSISKTKRERAGARRQGVRATGRQRSDGDLTDIWKLFRVFVFSDWNFLWKLYWEVVLWTQASCFSFMKMWFPFSPLFSSAAHSTWSCWDPHSQWVSVVGGADTLSSAPRGQLSFLIITSLQHWAGVEKSPLTLTVITVLGELLSHLWASRFRIWKVWVGMWALEYELLI